MSAYKLSSQQFLNLQSDELIVDDLLALRANIANLSIPTVGSASQVVYVNKGGNDVSGDGSIMKPYSSIQRALSSITDASPVKQYSISLGPGLYANSFAFKPYVGIVGTQPSGISPGISTIATPSVTFDANSWAAAPQGSAYFSFLSFNNGMALTLPNSVAALNFLACVINSDCSYTAAPLNVDPVQQSIVWGDTIVQRGNLNVQNCSFNLIYSTTEGNVFVTATPEAGNVHVGGLGGSLLGFVNLMSSGSNSQVNAILSGTAMTGGLIVDGANTLVTATSNAIPPILSLANGAVVTRSTNANTLGFFSSAGGDWKAPAPVILQDAVDRLANAFAYANSHSGIMPLP